MTILNKRDKFLIKTAKNLLYEATYLPQTGMELHIFDFDETLAYTPSATYSLYLGYYVWKAPFQVISPEMVDQAVALFAELGVVPYAVDSVQAETGPTKVLRFDYKGYEKLRGRVTKEWRQRVLANAFPKLTSGKYPKSVSVKYIFPDEAERNPEDYVPLPGLEVLRSKQAEGHDIYICTARYGMESVNNIHAFLSANRVTLDPESIFAVGGSPKGKKVAMLIERHGSGVVYFYDDSNKNISSVRDVCCSLTNELNLVKYSRSVPGEVEFRETCGLNSPSDMTAIVNESYQIFRRMRKLSGI